MELAGPFKVEGKPYTFTIKEAVKTVKAERRLEKGKPVGWWKFDEAQGSTAADSFGQNNGIIHGATWTAGKIGNYALDFDGEDDYVNIDESGSLDISGNEITIAAWIKAKRIDKRQVIAAKTAGGDNTWLVEINPVDFDNGKLNFFLNTGDGGTNVGSRSPIAVDTWCHIVFVYNGTERIIYINGQVDTSEATSGDISTNDQPVRIGTWGSLSRFFNGIIDDVRIYNYALSKEEVAAVYGGEEIGKRGNWIPVLVILVIVAAVVVLIRRGKTD